MQTTHEEDVVSSPMKLSDVLKRKRGPKRGAVGARKSRTACAEDAASLAGPGCSMDGHDYLRSGASGGSSSGGARSKFGFPSMSGSSNGSAPPPPPIGGATKASSFLASLNPARWGRSHHHNHSSSASSAATSSPGSMPNVPKSLSNPQLAGNREKVKTWIREQANLFLSTYFSSPLESTPGGAGGVPGAAGEVSSSFSALSILGELTSLVQRLDEQLSATPASTTLSPGQTKEILEQIRAIVADSDVSSFEILHSGLVRALLKYLTLEAPDRDERLRVFLREFLHCSPTSTDDVNASTAAMSAAPHLTALINKLSGCVNQLEQFPVRVHDLPAPAGTSGASGGYFRSGTSALRFFNTHQLKCNLQRHPSCNNVKQWKGGPVKIDPLALVQAIEKYLVIRGYGRIRDKDAADSDDDNSEEDVDDSLAAVLMNQGNNVRHKLQFLVNDHVIPYNMTVYQAIRQFGMGASGSGLNDQSETDTDSETPMGHASIWVQTHTICYRPVPENDPCNFNSPSGGKNASGQGTGVGCSAAGYTRKGKGATGKSSGKKKGDDLWNGKHPQIFRNFFFFFFF